jgi:phage tail tape-measure protein
LHGFLADLDTAAFADDAGEAAGEVRGAIAAPVVGGAWCPTPSQPATVNSAIVTAIIATS